MSYFAKKPDDKMLLRQQQHEIAATHRANCELQMQVRDLRYQIDQINSEKLVDADTIYRQAEWDKEQLDGHRQRLSETQGPMFSRRFREVCLFSLPEKLRKMQEYNVIIAECKYLRSRLALLECKHPDACKRRDELRDQIIDTMARSKDPGPWVESIVNDYVL